MKVMKKKVVKTTGKFNGKPNKFGNKKMSMMAAKGKKKA